MSPHQLVSCAAERQSEVRGIQKPIDPNRQAVILTVMIHSPGFLKIVNEARPRVKEIAVEEARSRLARDPSIILIDVREDLEWQEAHAPEAIHIGRGILERDLEKTVPDPGTEIIFYCGGGYRSILAADAAQRMGYRNVYSLINGYKGLVASGWKLSSGSRAG
jgi:rhodanese-related sulfurtransferase